MKDQVELALVGGDQQGRSIHHLIKKERIVIGSTEYCDVIIAGISPLHAVLESDGEHYKLYDLNSDQGTFVNGKKIVCEPIVIGDRIGLAKHQFVFRHPVPAEVVPPVLNVLATPPRPSLPPTRTAVANKSVPTQENFNYPLEVDPKAEFSEYIFEESDTVYPIFSYQDGAEAVEIIVLFEERILTVSYIPLVGRRTLYLQGMVRQEKDETIELPPLGRTERVPLLHISDDHVQLETIDGFEQLFIGQKKGQLSSNDIVKYRRQQVQVYIRRCSLPPAVQPAPLIKRDPQFRRYLLSSLILSVVMIITIMSVDRTEIQKKEDEVAMIPERTARILFKPKPKVHLEAKKPVVEPKVVEVKRPVPPPPKPEPKVVPKPIAKTAPAEKSKAVEVTAPKITQSGKMEMPKKVSTSAAPSVAKINTTSNAPAGKVQVYKSIDFSSTISSIMTKGDAIKVNTIKSAGGSGPGGIVGPKAIAGAVDGNPHIAKADVGIGKIGDVYKGSLGTDTVGKLVDKKGTHSLSGPDKTIFVGGIDLDQIRRILRDHIPQFQYCYQRQLDAEKRKLEGVIPLSFVIGPSGSVVKAGLYEQTNFPDDVKRCVKDVLMGIKFPSPGNGQVEVNQPMKFNLDNISI